MLYFLPGIERARGRRRQAGQGRRVRRGDEGGGSRSVEGGLRSRTALQAGDGGGSYNCNISSVKK